MQASRRTPSGWRLGAVHAADEAPRPAAPGLSILLACEHGSVAAGDELRSSLRVRGHRVALRGFPLPEAATSPRPDAVVLVGATGRGDLSSYCGRLREAIGDAALVAVGTERVRAAIAALDAGADDYVVHPCGIVELETRLRAILRRRRAEPDERLAAGDLVLEPATLRAWRGAAPVALTPGEFRVLAALLRRRGRVMSREELAAAAGSSRAAPASRSVDVCIHSLRRKIDRPFGRREIETVRGIGYRLSPAPVSGYETRPRHDIPAPCTAAAPTDAR